MDAVTNTYPDAELTEANDISGTVSGEMQQAAIKATLIACVAMLLYISLRFRDFRAGGSAIIALIHDVLIVLSAYALLRRTGNADRRIRARNNTDNQRKRKFLNRLHTQNIDRANGKQCCQGRIAAAPSSH